MSARSTGQRATVKVGASPFDAHKKGGAPPLIGGCRKDKLKKRPRMRKTTRVYAVVCSLRQRLFMCDIMHARHPATRGFRREDIRLMHTARTDARLRLCRPAARIASASAGEQHIFCAQSQTRPREGLFRHADGAVDDLSARQAYSHPARGNAADSFIWRTSSMHIRARFL